LAPRETCLAHDLVLRQAIAPPCNLRYFFERLLLLFFFIWGFF
jgi:hypothetical protein